MGSCRRLAGVGAVFAIAQVIEDYILTPRIIGGKLEWRPMLVFSVPLVGRRTFEK
jgi:predicted PurR-regulated permease PerM